MGKKLLSLFVSALFAVLFGMGGLWGGVLPLIDTTKKAYQVRHWQSTQASIDEVELLRKRGSKGGTTFAVKAQYSYTVLGQKFNGTAVGLSDSAASDNIGDWHQKWFNTLQEAKTNERSVPVWFNPTQPQQAMLDRNVRWSLVMFQLPFAILFTAVGLIAAIVFGFLLLDRPVPFASVLSHAKSNSGRISKNKQGQLAIEAPNLLFGWLFTVFWCSLSFPFTAMVWMTKGDWLAKGIVSLFAVIGVVLLYGVIKSSFGSRK
jgi:hypothetical protein